MIVDEIFSNIFDDIDQYCKESPFRLFFIRFIGGKMAFESILTVHIFYIDLQFSTDDEEFEEVVGEFETAAAALGRGEALTRSSQPINYLPGKFIF